MTHDVATIARSMETSVVKNYKKKRLVADQIAINRALSC
jgi:hypothetical protein